MTSWFVLLALAQSPPSVVTLRHSASPSAERCPDRAWLEGNVAARLGYTPFAPNSPRVATTRFDCTVSSCRAELELTDEKGGAPRKRTLTFADCRELAESLALTLALAIDPVRASAPPPPPAPTDAGVPLPPAVVEPPPPPSPRPEPPRVEPAPTTPTEVIGAVLVHGTAGVSPTISGGARVGVGIRRAWFGVTLEGRADLPASVDITGGSVHSSVLMGSVAPCFHLPVGLGFCAVGSLGALQIDGQFAQGARVSSVLALIGARVGWEHFFLSWFGVTVQATVQGVLTRTTVRANDRSLWVTAPVTGDVGVGVLFKY